MSATGNTAGPNPGLFFETVTAYQRAAALKAAIELHLFTAIGEGNATAAAIAKRCGTVERGARILCDYLATLGFLSKQQGKYGLTQDSAVFLDERSPAYAGAAVEFMQSPYLMGHFAGLTESVRRGGAAAEAEASVVTDHEMWTRFARGMAGLMAMPAQLLAKKTLAGATPPMKVLDIAAGHGLFGIAFAQQNPHAHIVGLDWPNVLAVAKENAGKMGVAGRYETIPGDALQVDFGADYDVVLLTNFLHHFDAATNERLLKKVHAALAAAGRAVALEFVPNEDRISPPMSATFSLVMLSNTQAGDAYTARELDAMFKNAGFAGTVCEDLGPGMEQVVTARK